jgi:hypothetical protein
MEGLWEGMDADHHENGDAAHGIDREIAARRANSRILIRHGPD